MSVLANKSNKWMFYLCLVLLVPALCERLCLHPALDQSLPVPDQPGLGRLPGGGGRPEPQPLPVGSSPGLHSPQQSRPVHLRATVKTGWATRKPCNYLMSPSVHTGWSCMLVHDTLLSYVEYKLNVSRIWCKRQKNVYWVSNVIGKSIVSQICFLHAFQNAATGISVKH